MTPKGRKCMAAKTNSDVYENALGLEVAVRKMWVVCACMLHRQLSHITVRHLGLAGDAKLS